MGSENNSYSLFVSNVESNTQSRDMDVKLDERVRLERMSSVSSTNANATKLLIQQKPWNKNHIKSY